MRAIEQKVSGQTSFESPTHSHVFLSSPKFCAQRQTFFFSLSRESVVIFEEKMRGENGDRKTDEWRLARDREGGREREEGWTSGSQ